MADNLNFLEKNILVYITGKEIFGSNVYSTVDELICDLNNFDYSTILQSAAKINYILKDEYSLRKSPEALKIAKQLFGNNINIFSKIQNFWESGRIIFSRQQLLSLIKTNLIYNNNNSGKKSIEEDFNGFGKILFGISDFLEENIGNDRKSIIGNIFKNIYLNYDHRLMLLLQRYYYLYSEIFDKVKKIYPDECFYFNNEFRNAVGMDIMPYLYLCYSILSHYIKNSDPELKDFYIDNNYFKTLKDEIKNNIEIFFSALALNKESLKLKTREVDKDFFSSFSDFWENPLFKIDSGVYFPIDFKFLTEKATIGIYWTIFNYLIKHNSDDDSTIKQNINKLRAFFGRCLEYYVYELFKKVYSRGLLQKIYYSEYDGDNTGNVDLILDYGNNLFFFEITSSNIKFNTALSANYEKIFNEIDLIFFGGDKDRKGKILQLDKAINNFKENKLKIDSISPKKIERIFPVLILQTGLPQAPGLFEEYKNRILKKGFLKDYIDDFTLIDFEELEYSLDLVHSENLSFADLLKEYKKSTYYNQSLKNFLYYNGYLEKLKVNNRKITSEKYKKFHYSATSYLFSEDIAKNLDITYQRE